MLNLPNYTNGSFSISEEKKILKDYTGKDFAVIYNAANSDLRAVKRGLPDAANQLKSIPLKKILEIIRESMKFYFESEESLTAVSRLTGSPYSFVKSSTEELKEWASHLEDYIVMCFGSEDYSEVPIKFKGKTLAFEKYIPSGPVVGILPKNSEAESIYLILQILLSKNPCIVKTSSSLGSNFSSLELVRSINKAVDSSNDPALKIIKKAINVVNIFDIEQSQIIKKLEIDGANYVVFGSNNTIKSIEQSLGNSPNKIIKMGTGLSISAVFKDADIDFAAEEICVSASIDRGNDCISTNIIYVEESIHQKFAEKIGRILHRYESKDPFHKGSIVGYINKDDVQIIGSRLKSLKSAAPSGYPETVHLSVMELDDHEHFEEFPGPVVGIRKFSNLEHFFSLFNEDMKRNGLKKNLVSAIFTKDAEKFDRIAGTINSYAFKLNKGSQKMNFLLEHQGTYLIKELLDKRIIEKNNEFE